MSVSAERLRLIMRAVTCADAAYLDPIPQPLNIRKRQHHARTVPPVGDAKSAHEQLERIHRANTQQISSLGGCEQPRLVERMQSAINGLNDPFQIARFRRRLDRFQFPSPAIA